MPMKPTPDHRKRELAAIHIARQQLGLDNGTYRDMLWTVARVRSAADLDYAGRQRVLDHLASRGAQIGGKRPAKSGGEWAFVERRPAHEHKQWRYLIVLCRQAGIARGRQVAYVEGIARRMAGLGRGDAIEKPAALWSGADLANVVNAMVYEAERAQRRARRV